MEYVGLAVVLLAHIVGQIVVLHQTLHSVLVGVCLWGRIVLLILVRFLLLLGLHVLQGESALELLLLSLEGVLPVIYVSLLAGDGAPVHILQRPVVIVLFVRIFLAILVFVEIGAKNVGLLEHLSSFFGILAIS